MSTTRATAPATPAPPAPAGEPPLAEAEIVAAAVRMQLADGAGAGVRLLPRLLDPQLTLDTLSALLTAEPALAIRVLRVANAPYYGQAGSVATLARATQLLGLDALRGVAAAACFDGMSAGAWRPAGPDPAAFKRHSLASGLAALGLARRLAPGLAEQAFLTGLLHDIGLLLLWRLRPATMAALGSRSEIAKGVGIHLADCGRLLMQTWALPSALAAAIAEHQRAGDDLYARTAPSLAGLLRMGHSLAVGAGFGLADEAPTSAATPDPTPPAGWEAACAELATNLPRDMERLATALAP
jgi:HD-like signal output (HDOD) protein